MSVTQQAAPGGLSTGQALIAGKAVSQRSISTQQGRRWLTVVALPQVDEFTPGGVIELRSENKLAGAAGEIVRAKVQITGYRRSFDVTDKETGERSRVNSAQITLDVI